MPRFSTIDTLPEADRAVVLRKLDYLQHSHNDRRRMPVLRNFSRMMADKLGYSESTISHVLTGRNKNPDLIEALYDHLTAITGQHESTVAVYDKIAGRQNPTSFEARAESVAEAAMTKEKEILIRVMGIREAAREIRSLYADTCKLWASIDGEITMDWLYKDHAELTNMVGGGEQSGRVILTPDDMAVLAMVDNWTVRESTREDLIDLAMKSKGTMHDSIRAWAVGIGMKDPKYAEAAAK